MTYFIHVIRSFFLSLFLCILFSPMASSFDDLQVFDQHIREYKQEAVAGVQSRSNESMSQLFITQTRTG